MDEIEHATIVRFLESPGSYMPPPDRVERLETHGAIIFLAGDMAFKIKKPVAFSYMDFSSLERRYLACRRELEINQPHAPGIYLDIVAVTLRPDGTLELGGNGMPVEWCVRMRRFPQSDLLAVIAKSGPMDEGLCRDLARAVAAYHRTAAVAIGADGVTRMEAVAAEVCDELDASAKAGLATGDVGELRRRVRLHMQQSRSILARRGRLGFIRRGHGDLHLGNIVLWEGAPTPFDALEFDEELATIDTLYDLAFLLMDLDQRGQLPAANLVLNRYLWHTQELEDLHGLVALPLFLALRAGVRAMVSAQRAAQAGGAARRDAVAEAKAYMRHAVDALEPSHARLVAVGGLSGTGKSTLSALIAPRLGTAPGAVHLRSDLERKSMLGCAETDRLPGSAYGRETSERVYQLLMEKAEAVVRAGRDVIVDAVFAQPQERMAVKQIADRVGVPFLGIWLRVSPALMRDRVEHRRGDASDATVDVVDRQLAFDTGMIDWPVLMADREKETLADTALQLIGKSPFVA